PFFDPSGPCHSILVEAQPGRRMDRFQDVRGPDEMITRLKEMVHDMAPWEDATVRDIALTDPMAWTTGAIVPTVRRPFALLPSGHVVMGVGDVVILNDPLAGQGAQCASKWAHFLTARIVERGVEPFDRAWMESAFEAFWEQDAKRITAFSNLILEPLEP